MSVLSCGKNSDEKLHISADGQGIVIKGERSEFKLPAQNPDEFPSVEEFDDKAYLEVPALILKELIRRTLFATDTESSRYALGGVLLELDKETITAVGTDGRRLAKMEGGVKTVGSYKGTDSMTIVPSKSMQLIDRAIVGDAEASVQVVARPNDILLKSANATIYSRLVDGRFPKWRDVIPSSRDGGVSGDECRSGFLGGSTSCKSLAATRVEVSISHLEKAVSFSRDTPRKLVSLGWNFRFRTTVTKLCYRWIIDSLLIS